MPTAEEIKILEESLDEVGMTEYEVARLKARAEEVRLQNEAAVAKSKLSLRKEELKTDRQRSRHETMRSFLPDSRTYGDALAGILIASVLILVPGYWIHNAYTAPTPSVAETQAECIEGVANTLRVDGESSEKTQFYEGLIEACNNIGDVTQSGLE